LNSSTSHHSMSRAKKVRDVEEDNDTELEQENDQETHPLTTDHTQPSSAGKTTKKPPTATRKPPKREGICAGWKWFKEDPRNRYAFGVFLLFGVICAVCIAIRFGQQISGDILAGIIAVGLAIYGAHHFRVLLGLTVEVERTMQLNRDFKAENMELQREVDRLRKAHVELTGVQRSLQQSTQSFAENIERLRRLDETLNSLSDDHIQGVQKLRDLSSTVQSAIQNDLLQHERDILHKVMARMEFKDDKEGLNRYEYDRFLSALPLSFQRRFSGMNKTFDDFAGGDDVLDFQEFVKLADEFAVQEAKAGGSKQY